MKELIWDDFSGGVAADGAVVSDRQVLYAHGFVCEDGKTLRTQPGITAKTHPGPNGLSTYDMRRIWVLRHAHRTWEVTSLGDHIYWRAAGDAAWTTIDLADLFPGIVAWPEYGARITGLGRYRSESGQLLPAVVGTFQPTTAGGSHQAVFQLYPNSGGLAMKVFHGSDETGLPLADGNPVSGRVPVHAVCAMWRDFMLCAVVRWTAGVISGGVLTEGAPNYPNYAYVSDPLDPTKFDPRYPIRLADERDTVLHMVPVPEGLLVFHTGGINLLRGEPADFFGSEPTGALEHLSELRLPAETRGNAQTRPLLVSEAARFVSRWDAQQSVLFVSDNRLFQYRDGEISDISPYQGRPRQMEVAFPQHSPQACVSAGGKNVVFCNGLDGLVWHLTAHGESGSWTTLAGEKFEVPPPPEGMMVPFANMDPGIPSRPVPAPPLPFGVPYEPLVVYSTTYHDGQFIFVGFQPCNDSSPLGVRTMRVDTNLPGTRGVVGEERVPVFVQTAHAGVNSPHLAKHWHQAGLRARGRDPYAELISVATSGPLPFSSDDRADFQVELNEYVPATYRTVVPALGDTPLCSLTAVFRGDVQLLGVSLWYDDTIDEW